MIWNKRQKKKEGAIDINEAKGLFSSRKNQVSLFLIKHVDALL